MLTRAESLRFACGEVGDRHAVPRARSASIISGVSGASPRLMRYLSNWCAAPVGFDALAPGERGAGETVSVVLRAWQSSAMAAVGRGAASGSKRMWRV